jgi:hypothetical protein
VAKRNLTPAGSALLVALGLEKMATRLATLASKLEDKGLSGPAKKLDTEIANLGSAVKSLRTVFGDGGK